MSKFSRLDVGTKVLVTLAFVISGALTLGVNQYKSHYQKEEPVKYEDVSAYPEKVGYPAGDDIPVAKSIEDIMNNKYCTIEVSKDDIESIRYFLIKDKSEAGKKSGKVGRHYTSTTVLESFAYGFDLRGDFKYAIRQLGWNIQNTSYGEVCIVTLDSGERILTMVDTQLFDIPRDKKIKLPIGKVVENFYIEGVTDNNEVYGLSQENATWYVDMVGDWEEREVGDINVVLRFGIVLVIVFIALVFLMNLYDKRKKEGI